MPQPGTLPHGTVAKRIADAGEEIICTSIIVAADRCYGNIRKHLARKGAPIGPNDLLIAAHALALDLTVVTVTVLNAVNEIMSTINYSGTTEGKVGLRLLSTHVAIAAPSATLWAPEATSAPPSAL